MLLIKQLIIYEKKKTRLKMIYKTWLFVKKQNMLISYQIIKNW